jgi:hypothetical protein
MFILNKVIARNSPVDLEDMAKTKFALTSLNYYDDTKAGMSPYGDDDVFNSIKSFQKDSNLRIDGVMKPEGPTHTAIKTKLDQDKTAGNVFTDFIKNYEDMRSANTIGADKYFHCKANYEASQRGWSGLAAANFMSNMREAGNMAVDTFKKGVGRTVRDVADDQKANKYGRDAARAGNFSSASEACSIFRPKGLNDKY